jgi:hypothetical protein
MTRVLHTINYLQLYSLSLIDFQGEALLKYLTGIIFIVLLLNKLHIFFWNLPLMQIMLSNSWLIKTVIYLVYSILVSDMNHLQWLHTISPMMQRVSLVLN